MVLLGEILEKIIKEMYILKPDYVGTIMEILMDEMRIVFDTNIETEDRYEYFYNIGFDWAFEQKVY